MHFMPDRVTTAAPRSFAGSTRSAKAALIGLLILSAGCGSEGGTPVDPTDPTVPKTPVAGTVNTTVQFGPSVDAATRSGVTTFAGLSGSVQASGSGQLSVLEGSRSVVLARRADGKAVLGAMSLPGGATTVDARTSALLLVRLAAPASAIVPGGATELEARIATLPGFQALVDSVGARASRGLPLTGTAANVTQAHGVAAALAPPEAAPSIAPLPAASNAPEASRALFRSFSFVTAGRGVQLMPPSTVGGRVTLQNALLVPVLVETPSGEVAINRATLCLTCWPSRQFTQETGTFDVPRDAAFDVTIKLDQETVILQSVFDLAGVAFAKLADRVPDKDRAAKKLLEVMGVGIKALGKALESKSADEAVKEVFEYFQSEESKLAQVYEDLLAGANQTTLLTVIQDMLVGVVAVPLGAIEQRLLPVKFGLTFATAYKYWGEKPEEASWCIEERVLYGGCSAKVEIAPKETSLEKGKPADLFATVFDAKGRVLEGRKVRWESSQPDEVSVSTSDAATTVSIKAEKDFEKVTITARSVDQTGRATVTGGAGLFDGTWHGTVLYTHIEDGVTDPPIAWTMTVVSQGNVVTGKVTIVEEGEDAFDVSYTGTTDNALRTLRGVIPQGREIKQIRWVMDLSSDNQKLTGEGFVFAWNQEGEIDGRLKFDLSRVPLARSQSVEVGTGAARMSPLRSPFFRKQP